MPCKNLTSPSVIPAKAAVIDSENRYVAYRLGYMSRSNIEREVRRAEPRLHKLIGHCSLFDHARKVIIDQLRNDTHDAEDEASGDEGDFWLDDGADDKDEPAVAYVEDLQAAKPATPQRIVVVTATQVETEDYDGLEWEYDSDSTTGIDEDEDCSDDDWSDSTCDDCCDHHHPNSKTIDIYPATKIMPVRHSHHHQLQHKHQDDDLVLWSQQPRVMSQNQADHLLFEAMG